MKDNINMGNNKNYTHKRLDQQYIPLNSKEMSNKFNTNKKFVFKKGSTIKTSKKRYGSPYGNCGNSTSYINIQIIESGQIDWEQTFKRRKGKQFDGIPYDTKSSNNYLTMDVDGGQDEIDARDLIKIWNNGSMQWYDIISSTTLTDTDKIQKLRDLTKIGSSVHTKKNIQKMYNSISNLVKEFSQNIKMAKMINQKYFNKWFRQQPINSDTIKQYFNPNIKLTPPQNLKNTRKPYRIFLPFVVQKTPIQKKLFDNSGKPIMDQNGVQKTTTIMRQTPKMYESTTNNPLNGSEVYMYNWIRKLLQKTYKKRDRDGKEIDTKLFSILDVDSDKVMYRQQQTSLLVALQKEYKVTLQQGRQQVIPYLVNKIILPHEDKNISSVDEAIVDKFGYIPNKLYYVNNTLCYITSGQDNRLFYQELDNDTQKLQLLDVVKKYMTTAKATPHMIEVANKYGCVLRNNTPIYYLVKYLNDKTLTSIQLRSKKIKGKNTTYFDFVMMLLTQHKQGQWMKQFYVKTKTEDQVSIKRFNNESENQYLKYMIMISRHPYDILQASTGKRWASCTQLNTGQNRYYTHTHYEDVYYDGSQMNMVAYVLPGDLFTNVDGKYTKTKKGDVLDYALGRMNIAPYRLQNNRNSLYWWTQYHLYTDQVQDDNGFNINVTTSNVTTLKDEHKLMAKLNDVVNSWLKLKQISAPSGTYNLMTNTCYSSDHYGTVKVNMDDNRRGNSTPLLQILPYFQGEILTIQDIRSVCEQENTPSNDVENFISDIRNWGGDASKIKLYEVRKVSDSDYRIVFTIQNLENVNITFDDRTKSRYKLRVIVKNAKNCSISKYKESGLTAWSIDKLQNTKINECMPIYFKSAINCQIKNTHLFPSAKAVIVGCNFLTCTIGKQIGSRSFSRFQGCTFTDTHLYMKMQKIADMVFKGNCSIGQVKKLENCTLHGSLKTKDVSDLIGCKLYLNNLYMSDGNIQNCDIFLSQNSNLTIMEQVNIVNSSFTRNVSGKTYTVKIQDSRLFNGTDTVFDMSYDLFAKQSLNDLIEQFGYKSLTDTQITNYHNYAYMMNALGSNGIIVTINNSKIIYPNVQAISKLKQNPSLRKRPSITN